MAVRDPFLGCSYMAVSVDLGCFKGSFWVEQSIQGSHFFRFPKRATVNMDGRAKFRTDMGLHIGVVLGPLLKSLY